MPSAIGGSGLVGAAKPAHVHRERDDEHDGSAEQEEPPRDGEVLDAADAVGEDEVSSTGSADLEESSPPQAARLVRSAVLRKAAARRRATAGVRVRDVVTVEFFPPREGTAPNLNRCRPKRLFRALRPCG